MIVDYDPSTTKIRNTDQLPKGTGCRYLLCVTSPIEGEYVAERWLRSMPRSIARGKVVIRF